MTQRAKPKNVSATLPGVLLPERVGRPPLKHRWSVGTSLAGLALPEWKRLLRENRHAIDPVYAHRAAFITLVATIRSAYVPQEERRFGKAIEATKITEPPLFILGHWRSGTTHLHNLISQDSEQFAYPNVYQAFNPQIFLSTEETIPRRFAALMPKKRLMDNVARSFGSPQEDEIAVSLTSLRSPYLGMAFPRREDYYDRYLTFRGVAEAELAEWSREMLRFLKKLTLKHRRSLALKSPTHTARIRLLLELFPNARFIHIHRNPYAVYQSTLHHNDTARWHAYLQRPDLRGHEERILRRYTELYDAFFEEKALIPPGRFVEVAFEDVERDPVGQVRAIYEQLGLQGFSAFQPALDAYVASLKGYTKNQFVDLDPGVRRRVAVAWERSFATWGYSA